jgi:hypothetical protein
MLNKLKTIELLKSFAPKLVELEMYFQLKNKPTFTITKQMMNIVWNSMKDFMMSQPTSVISTERKPSTPPEPQNKNA